MTASSFGFLSGFGIRIPVLVRVLRGKNLPCSSLRVFQDLCGKKFPGLCNRKCCTHLRTWLCSHLRRRKPLILLVCHDVTIRNTFWRGEEPRSLVVAEVRRPKPANDSQRHLRTPTDTKSLCRITLSNLPASITLPRM